MAYGARFHVSTKVSNRVSSAFGSPQQPSNVVPVSRFAFNVQFQTVRQGAIASCCYLYVMLCECYVMPYITRARKHPPFDQVPNCFSLQLLCRTAVQTLSDASTEIFLTRHHHFSWVRKKPGRKSLLGCVILNRLHVTLVLRVYGILVLLL